MQIHRRFIGKVFVISPAGLADTGLRMQERKSRNEGADDGRGVALEDPGGVAPPDDPDGGSDRDSRSSISEGEDSDGDDDVEKLGSAAVLGVGVTAGSMWRNGALW